MQSKCSLMQCHNCAAVNGASITMERCVGHKGMFPLTTNRERSVRALRCTNCRGCKDCQQPVPLVIPEGTGGSGCAAEVAAKAEALRCLVVSEQKGSSAQACRGDSVGGSNQATGLGTSVSEASALPANDALVECAVCHRRPGDPGVPATLKLCGGCQAVRYCSADCQKKDWKFGHKVMCQRLAERMKSRRTCKS
jgi:hypothetical protein